MYTKPEVQWSDVQKNPKENPWHFAAQKLCT